MCLLQEVGTGVKIYSSSRIILGINLDPNGVNKNMNCFRAYTFSNHHPNDHHCSEHAIFWNSSSFHLMRSSTVNTLLLTSKTLKKISEYIKKYKPVTN